MTPRKARQRQNINHNSSTGPSNLNLNQVLASDYESEVPYQTPTTRKNEELNLSVLQSYNPSITAILSIAPSATIYTFEATAWERTGVEGTLFVCQLAPHSSTGAEAYCIVILNRRALENLIMDVRDMENVEIQDDYLILQVLKRGSGGEEERKRVLGVFIHADKEETRRVNNMMVKECWESVKQTENHYAREMTSGVEEQADGLDGGGHGQGGSQYSHPGFGRRVSVTDLFGR